MSITRLQQARQMYAMGQRVGRIAFGGGGSYSSQGGYQGKGGAATGGSKGSKAGGAGTGTDNKGNTGGGNDNPFSSGYQGAVTQTKTATPMDVREQYAVNNPTTLGAPIAPPTVSPFLEAKRKDNYIDAFNLSNSTYKPLRIPPFIPGSTLINTAGNFLGNLGYKKNTRFFADNVAGKYGYGYGEDAYKDYMKARQLGNVNAYGRPLTEGELRLRDGDGGGDNGIMDVYNNPNEPDDGDADGDGDSDQDDFIFRYFDKTGETLQAGAGGVEDLMTRIRERISNIFS